MDTILQSHSGSPWSTTSKVRLIFSFVLALQLDIFITKESTSGISVSPICRICEMLSDLNHLLNLLAMAMVILMAILSNVHFIFKSWADS